MLHEGGLFCNIQPWLKDCMQVGVGKASLKFQFPSTN